MKKILFGGLLAVSFSLVGCNQSLNSEEVVTEVKSNQETVENYHSIIDLGISITEQESKQALQDTLTRMDVVINEETLDTYGTITVEDLAYNAVQEYYSVGEEAYLKANEGGWQDVSAQKETLFENTQTFYKNVVPIVETISNVGEMTEDDDSYTYTFQGINEDLYAAFEVPYGISFGNYPTNQVEQDALVSVNKETLLIEEISNTLSGAQQGQELTIEIQQTYDKINEMNDISIPQEVLDTANAQ